jgi:C-terminal processing protease CtpA/Prc
MMDRAFLDRAPQMFCNKHLQYGHVADSIGYLRILSFGGFTRHNDLLALEMAMDKIFSDARLKALIIDMRLSFGGSDELGLAIASRLADREYLAYTVQARSNHTKRDQWTEPEPIMIRPAARPGFRGPVVELTSSITMSAAETFSQALMGRVPRITRIGENTQGVFCDVLDRHLPNGWTFGLPNAVYRTANGTAFDVTGIPPDIDVPLFSEGDLAAGRDPGLAKAVQLLTASPSQNH